MNEQSKLWQFNGSSFLHGTSEFFSDGSLDLSEGELFVSTHEKSGKTGAASLFRQSVSSLDGLKGRIHSQVLRRLGAQLDDALAVIWEKAVFCESGGLSC